MRSDILPLRPAHEATQAPPRSTVAERETRRCRINDSEAMTGEFKDTGTGCSN